MDPKLQKEFQAELVRKNLFSSFEHFLEMAFAEREVKTVEELIKDSEERKTLDVGLLAAAEKELAEKKATGNLKYEDRKALEHLIATHKDNIAGQDDHQKNLRGVLQQRKTIVQDHKMLGERDLQKSQLAESFEMTITKKAEEKPAKK